MRKVCRCMKYGRLNINPLPPPFHQVSSTLRRFMSGHCWLSLDSDTSSKPSWGKTKGSGRWSRRTNITAGKDHRHPAIVHMTGKETRRRGKTRKSRRSIITSGNIHLHRLLMTTTNRLMKARWDPPSLRVSTRSNSKKRHCWKVSSRTNSQCSWHHIAGPEGRGRQLRHPLFIRKMRRKYWLRLISRSLKEKRRLLELKWRNF